MNSQVFAALVLTAATIGLGAKVDAQSSGASRASSQNYTVQGDSLTGINDRTAENDFASFFAQKNSQNTNLRNNFEDSASPSGVWQIGDQFELRRNDPARTPNEIIFPQADQSFYNNDGVQVQIGQ